MLEFGRAVKQFRSAAGSFERNEHFTASAYVGVESALKDLDVVGREHM